MVIALLLMFVVAPAVELYVALQVASSLGVGETVLAVVAASLVGVWLAKMAGFGVLRRLQSTVRQQRVPSAEVVDGALVLTAGVLMFLPGFVSGGLGLLLLLPPSRALVRGSVLRRIRAGGGLIIVGGRREPTVTEVWDIESWEQPPGRPEIGP
jgi:UPF0716 protein FxsA